MGLDLSTAADALKEFYLPVVREQLTNNNEYLAQIETSSESVEGLETVLSLHVSRNQGIGARAELGALPTAGSQGYKKQRVDLTYQYGVIQVSGPVIKAAASDKGGWIRAVESETKGVVADEKRDEERQLLGTSNGVIATCGTTSASTTVVTSATKTQLRHLQVGMLIDIGTLASPTTIASSRTIEAVDLSNGEVEISGAAVTTTSSHFIFRAGNGGDVANSNKKEFTGLQTIVDSAGSLFGVDPASYPVWSSYEDDASGAAISDTLIEELIDEVDIVSPSGAPTWGIADHGQVRKLAASLKSQKRFANTVALKGGFTALEVSTASGTINVSALRDCPVETFFGLNPDHLGLHEASEWDFMDLDGAVLSRVAGYDAYGATLYHYAEHVTDVRNAHGKITGLAAA
jgi:hypothetical protein